MGNVIEFPENRWEGYERVERIKATGSPELAEALVPYLLDGEFPGKAERERLYAEFRETMEESEAHEAADELAPEPYVDRIEMGFHATVVADWSRIAGAGQSEFLTAETAARAGLTPEKAWEEALENLASRTLKVAREAVTVNGFPVVGVSLKEDVAPSVGCSVLLSGWAWGRLYREMFMTPYLIRPAFRNVTFACADPSAKAFDDAVAEIAARRKFDVPFSGRTFRYDPDDGGMSEVVG